MAIVSLGLCSQLTIRGRKLLPTHTASTFSNSMMRLPPLKDIVGELVSVRLRPEVWQKRPVWQNEKQGLKQVFRR